MALQTLSLTAAQLLVALEAHKRTGTLVYYPPADAFVPSASAFRLSLVRAGGHGHRPTGDWPFNGAPGQQMPYFAGPDLASAQTLCDQLNARMGVSPEEAALIVAHSMAPPGTARGQKARP